MTRYLLGELSPQEQAALEENYFSDVRIFESVLKAETKLVDRYVRGRLSAAEREKFERSYLTHPQRLERVKFAEAFVTRIDQTELARKEARNAVMTVSGWQSLLEGLFGPRPVLTFSLALASLLLVVGALWLYIANSGLRRDLAQNQADQGAQDRRARELEQQLAAERKTLDQLAVELRGGFPSQPDAPKTSPTPPTRAVPTSVSMLLTVGGVRSGETGKTPKLVIPPGVAEARLQLNMKANDYSRYSVSLQKVSGEEIFSRPNLKPKTSKSGASFTFIVSAVKFSSGDYILTLRGVSQDGEIEDLSKSIFRVEKR